MSKRSLLIIDKHQFGQLTDTFKWCEYLRDEYDVTIITPKGKGVHKSMDNVRIVTVSGKNRIIFGVKYLMSCFIELLRKDGPVIVVYFEGCELLKRFLPHKRMILDIRTLSVDSNPEVRLKYNDSIKSACLKFDHVTCISKGIVPLLGLNENEVTILPLGADPLSKTIKDFAELKLLYVGTLTGRNIDQTIEGVCLFMKRHPEVKISYDIAGTGWFDEEESLKLLVVKLGCADTIVVRGRVSEEEKEYLFKECNVGVSYIPKTEYYDYQPPTKSYEYVLSGMVCLATSTHANCEIINKKNGVLIDDTPESFCEGVEIIYNEKRKFKSDEIKATLQEYHWSSIVKQILMPVLARLWD